MSSAADSPTDVTARWVLRPLGVPGLAQIIEIPDDGLTFGRDPACAVRLDPADFPQVSAHHARLSIGDDGPVVEDLGSTNGTHVNDVEVKERRVLLNGDVVQLGDLGPRFAVVRHASLDDTLEVAPGRLVLGGLGGGSMSDLRDALGAADQEDVDTAVRSSGRRNTLFTLGVAGVVIAVGVTAILFVRETSRRETAALRELSENLATQLQDARAELDLQRETLATQREAVTSERDDLLQRIQTTEARATGAEGAIEERLDAKLRALRGQLETANTRLELFDPVSLEKERLREVAGVQAAVVLIEARTRLRDSSSRRQLYVATSEDGRQIPNLDFDGVPYEQESSGSGFCISREGHVLTNAHVVLPADRRPRVAGPDGLEFEVETDLYVVFTGTSRRLPARVLRVTSAADQDLAVIQIAPFDDMPVIPSFDTALPTVAPGTEVYLFGFPLGKLVMQEGDRVVASAFKGILSREVGEYLQVDAGVHPGNSGGPVTDGHGRVVGIVTRVQATPSGELANAIGYVIPIRMARAVWPLQPPDGAEVPR